MTSRRHRVTRLGSILVLLSLLSLGACAPLPAAPLNPEMPLAPEAAISPHVDVLRLPGGGYWGHPSPFGINRGPGYVRASLLFDTLVWRDASGTTIPWLATDWQVSEDGLTWTFTLREGVRWHDGQPFTAADVVFSIDYLKVHPGAAWFTSRIDEVASAVAVSDHRVDVTLVRPFAPFIQMIAEAVLIFPQHIWQQVDDPQAYIAPEAFVGTGAYKLVEYSQAEGAYLFEANPDFFLGDPYVQRIEFVPTSDNILALSTGSVAAFEQFGGVTEEMLAPFREPPFEIQQASGEWGLFLYFNLEQESPLQDVRVRQAIAYAIDRQAMVDRVLYGFGGMGSPGYLPPANPFYNPDVSPYELDLDVARALLDEAGYEGAPIELSYSSDSVMGSARVVEIIEAGLAEAGIPLEIVTLDQASLDAAATEGRYQMLVTGFGGLGSDPDLMRANLASTSRSRGFARAVGYNNEAFDELAESQVLMDDLAERRAAVAEMQSILAEDLPALALYYTDRLVVYNADLFDNWYFTPGGFGAGIPLPYNKHQFIAGQLEGLEIRSQ